MRIFDIFLLIAYVWSIPLLAYLVPALIKYFGGRLRVQVVGLFMVSVVWVASALAGLMATGFWNRYVKAIGDNPETLTPAGIYTWAFFLLMFDIGLTLMAWILATKRMDRFIVWGKNGRNE